MTIFERYYTDQAGNGIAGFSGVRYQKGFGFFGRLLSGAVLPFLRFLGKNALNAGANIAKDIVDSDDFSFNNIKDASKKRFQEKGKELVKKGADKILNGNGFRKRRKSIKVIKKKVKSKKVKVKKPRKTKKVKKRVFVKDFLSK